MALFPTDLTMTCAEAMTLRQLLLQQLHRQVEHPFDSDLKENDLLKMAMKLGIDVSEFQVMMVEPNPQGNR